MPLLRDFHLDRIDDEMVDMMGYDVVGEGDGARFLITHQGARLPPTATSASILPNGPAFSTRKSGPNDANVVDLYRARLRRSGPAYSISTVQDADGKEVSYERLLMPFGSGEAVQQIVGSFKSISIEGGFKISNLMGLRPKAEPVILVRAIIDRAFVPTRRARIRPTNYRPRLGLAPADLDGTSLP
jgi:hypothetical protein